jgi:hypothetical protein
MKSTVIALTLTTLSVLLGSSSPASADEAKVARGTVAAIGAKSVTVKVGDQDMTFAVDSKTLVETRGGSTKSGQAAAAGKRGPQLSELIAAGQPVAVTYTGTAGALHATGIKTIPKSAAAPAGTKAENAGEKKSAGVVKSMGADWITINGSGGGGSSFEQTFKIGSTTKVFAKGAGTAAAAKGGKMPFADILTSGDHVSVSYRVQGDSLLASDVHVTMKATH